MPADVDGYEPSRNRIGILPYFPLASGLVTGKYKRGAPQPADTRLVER